jgi:translation elongation factor EF-1alpha
VSFNPGGPAKAYVYSMQLHGTDVAQAAAGDNLGLQVKFSSRDCTSAAAGASAGAGAGKGKGKGAGADRGRHPQKGMILTLSNEPSLPTVQRCEAQVLIMRGAAFKVGYKPSLTTHIVTVSVHVTRLIEVLGRNNAVVETSPTETKAGQTVVCELLALRPFVAETIHDMPKLSRFIIKENRVIVGIGFIKRIL